jgi:hypothetical protein
MTMDVFCVCVLLSQLYWTAVDTNGNADPASQQARDETEQVDCINATNKWTLTVEVSQYLCALAANQ